MIHRSPGHGHGDHDVPDNHFPVCFVSTHLCMSVIGLLSTLQPDKQHGAQESLDRVQRTAGDVDIIQSRHGIRRKLVIFIFIICFVISKQFGFSSLGSSFKVAGTGCSVDNNRAHLYPCSWEIYKILFIGIILTTRQYHKDVQNARLYVICGLH